MYVQMNICIFLNFSKYSETAYTKTRQKDGSKYTITLVA